MMSMKSLVHQLLVLIAITTLAAVPLFGQVPCKKAVDPLTSLNEPELGELSEGSTLRIYRMIIAPSWGNRFCFTIESTASGGLLVMKRLEGQAGYGDGPLAETKEFQLTLEELRTFEALVDSSGYEQMGVHDPDAGLDGDNWSLEVSKRSFHHEAIRWCPNVYKPKKRGTEGFVRVFRWAADKAGVTKVITNKGRAIFFQDEWEANNSFKADTKPRGEIGRFGPEICGAWFRAA